MLLTIGILTLICVMCEYWFSTAVFEIKIY